MSGVDWLMVVLVSTYFETVFKPISGRLPERKKKKREMTDARKNVQTTPFRTYCSAVVCSNL